MTNVYELATAKILELLEKNENPWTKPWVTRGLNQQKNLSSLRPYTGLNALILAMENQSTDYWLTYKQAQELGMQVRKGEKSAIVVGWFKSSYKSKDESEAGEENDGNEPVTKSGLRCRYFRVFNLSQLDNVPATLLEKAKRPDIVPFITGTDPAAEQVINQTGAKINFGVEQACYRPSADEIFMPDRERFEHVAEFYSTMFHELGHWTGHSKRLNRLELTKGTMFASKTYSQEELCAEMTSVYVCSSLNISSESALRNSSAYIKNWMKFLKDNPKAFVIACQQGQKAANYILKGGPVET